MPHTCVTMHTLVVLAGWHGPLFGRVATVDGPVAPTARYQIRAEADFTEPFLVKRVSDGTLRAKTCLFITLCRLGNASSYPQPRNNERRLRLII